MTGGYTTQTRTGTVPILRHIEGYAGEPGTPGTRAFPVPPPVQTTYSFRTNRNEAEGITDLGDEGSARLFRSGFATYDPQWDRGHEFWSKKDSYFANTPNVYLRGDVYGREFFYRGPLIPKVDTAGGWSGTTYPGAARISSSDIATFGQRAISSLAPTAPHAGAAQAVAELRQALPQIPGMTYAKKAIRGDFLTGLADEYLNWQFGLAPLLSDCRKIAASLKKQTEILRQLQRDNGRVIRRRMAFPAIISSNELQFDGVYGPYYGAITDSNIAQGWPRVSRITRTERSIWFSGAFSYWMPIDDSMMSRLDSFMTKANVLLGVKASPDVLWELAPWSWLVDWQAAIGTMLSAATRTSEDNLVIRYGYLMSHTVTEQTYSVPPHKDRVGNRIPPTSLTLRSEVKERVRSTPYGFGMDFGALTDNQLAILLALGITKGRGVAV